MSTKDELYALATSIYEHVKNDLARDGDVPTTHILHQWDGKRMCIVESSDVDKDEMIAGLKLLAPAFKAVASFYEVWAAPVREGVRPSANPDRWEAIVVLVQSKEGSWMLMSKFDRDEHGKPGSPTPPVMDWTDAGRCGILEREPLVLYA